MEDDLIKGRFAAIELLLGQLFAAQLEYNTDPQRWLADNVWRNSDRLGRRVHDLDHAGATSALEYIRTVMQTASSQLEPAALKAANR